MNLAEMKAKLEGLKADASAILDKIEAGTASEADESRLDELKAEMDTLKGDIAQVEKVADLRREMGAATSRPAMSLSTNEPDPETTHGFKSLAEFAASVRSASTGGGFDRRLMGAPTNAHQGGGGDGEGFLVPTEYSANIFRAVEDTDNLVSRFNVQQTGARSIEFLRDESTPWAASGITAYWRKEGNKIDASKTAMKATRMEIHDMAVLATVTDEMLSDAPRINQLLTRDAAQAIAWKAGEALMWGDGVGKPLGFMNGGGMVEVAKESGQADDTIVPANVNKMFSRLLMVGGSNAFWLANNDILPQLQSMAFGTDTPLFYPAGGINDAPNGTLLGRPIVYTEHAETLGTKGDLVLVTPAGYIAAQRGGGVQFAQSMHLFFDYATEAFRWMFRMGGMPLLSAPVTPARGSATKGHFVALADRG